MIGLDVVGFALPLDETEHAALWQRLASRANGHVNGMSDTPGGQADVAMKIIEVWGSRGGWLASISLEINLSRVRPEADARRRGRRAAARMVPGCRRAAGQSASWQQAHAASTRRGNPLGPP